VFNYVAAPPEMVTDLPIRSPHYQFESDQFGTGHDEDEYNGTTLVADGLSGDFKFTINGVERTHETEFGTCRSASITALGTVDGNQLFLLSYIDKGTLYYAVYDWEGNAVKDFTALTDAKKLTGVRFNEQGDFILSYVVDTSSGDWTYYSRVRSGYDAAPVAFNDATATSSAETGADVYLWYLGKDLGPQPMTVENISVGAVETSDGSTGSVIAVKSPFGGILAIYTGILAEGETATVAITYSVTDGSHTDTDGLLTMTFTGIGSDLVYIDAGQAKALIAAGYESLADIGGSISGFAVAAESLGYPNLVVSYDDLAALGVTTIYSRYGELWVPYQKFEEVLDAGITYSASDHLILSDYDGKWIPQMDAADIADLAAKSVDEFNIANGRPVLGIELIQAIIDNNIAFGTYDLVTIADTAANVFALDSAQLDAMAAAGVKLIDLDDRNARNNAAAFETLAEAGYKFVKEDQIILETTVAEASTFNGEQLAAFATMRVDYVAFTDDGMPSAALVKKITTAGITVSDPDLPSEGDDRLVGTDADDEINAHAGSDRIAGGIGNDKLLGGKGRDSLAGQDGDDVLDGGTGNDVLFGGPGADTFVFRPNSGRDWIEDFSAVDGPEHDLIDLSRIEGISKFADLDIREGKYDRMTIIVDDQVRVRLYDVDIEDLDKTDFIFG
jgi:Ca2+-binding RTX toxin-like protein